MDDLQPKPLRVLHVVGGMDRGGAETMIMNFYRKIDRTKIQFDFLCMKRGEHHYDEEIRSLGGRIIHIDPPKSVGIIKHIYDMMRVMRKYGPFIAIHAHTQFHSGIVAFAAFLAGIRKRICHSHTTSDMSTNNILRRLYFRIMRVLIRIFATKMLACSNEAGAFLFGTSSMKSGNVFIFQNAIDLSKYELLSEKNAIELKHLLNLPIESIILGHVGRFSQPKNHKFLVQLMKYVKANSLNIFLVLVGDGELRRDIENIVKVEELNEYIKFLGIREDIPELMNMFDVFIMPSLYEGLPVVLVEAQAAGTPCIVSDRISREVDFGLNLIEFVSLDAPVEEWVDKIVKRAGTKLKNFSKIREAYKKRKFDVDEVVKEIEKIYMD
ncbi:glycosyltransferase family 1 protein [Caldicellulosiruptor morganii]|uniref:Glycosyltransferase family 1 protein n=1 Tax=Caldicellulosiruptor morganii TaxID=1387555 RepID=A0ABY7BLF0_9FIRM|nr:glycosyltransferase family 1 protein [Caldicellulosiruptor morganii]WAM33634.1 glycosyltransferase family 1 protein [Caldicellulosiruptor morganii]